jgi:hypothetical protein
MGSSSRVDPGFLDKTWEEMKKLKGFLPHDADGAFAQKGFCMTKARNQKLLRNHLEQGRQEIHWSLAL